MLAGATLLVITLAFNLGLSWANTSHPKCAGYSSEPALSGCGLFHYLDLDDDDVLTWDEYNRGLTLISEPEITREQFVPKVMEETGLCGLQAAGLFYAVSTSRNKKEPEKISQENKVFTWLALPDIQSALEKGIYSSQLCGQLTFAEFQRSYAIIYSQLPECSSQGSSG